MKTADDLLQALGIQRMAALDQAASYHADLMAARREIARLKAEIETLKKPPESPTPAAAST